MGNTKGKHLNIMGVRGLGNQTIPSRLEGARHKATHEEPTICLKCLGTVLKQFGRQFVCVLCGEDVWLVQAK